ncbi:hypothetical protein [Seonamhaeicola marinus]|uniref:Uncharacterized protein n=1 Tax=Seonamhaeicola marinus TaxID=1912246 RepID=A0A5D0HJ29_9FLAO|nr:hypothetical protein [Seonamhaeicola marinus]TYA71393.1 hypothetical protein FUA24_17570 [Seonamhaeicola marinus]
MKNSTLVFRSLAVIIFIAGTAHLVGYTSQSHDLNYRNNGTYETPLNNREKLSSEENNANTVSLEYSETDYIIGKWKVNYNSDDFKGAIIYSLKKEGDIYNAYSYEYQDEKGYAEKAENVKTLTIKTFDGYKGKGIYRFEYEGEQHQVDCSIDMVDENTFKLSYDYYGYADVETWKRQ